MLEEPAEKLHDVEVGGAEACTAHFPGGERDGAVREAHETVVGDSDLEDIRSEVGDSGVAVVLGLTVDVPGDGPDLGIDTLEQTGAVHLFFDERPVDGRERFHGNQEVGAGGAPGCAVRGETTTGHNVMDVGVVLELPPPGVQDPGEPQEIGPDEALIFGELLKGHGSGLKQSLVRGALMRADEGTQGLRDREGEEEVRSRELFVEVVLEPLLSCMLLTLGAVAIATGMIDAMWSATGWALIEAVAVRTALALLDGADALAVRGGERGIALQILWGKGRADLTQGDHGTSPCMRALRRS